jgi:hypothetical protein
MYDPEDDIDYMYDKYIDDLSEQQRIQKQSQTEIDQEDRRELWDAVFGPEQRLWSKTKREVRKKRFANAYNLRPFQITWEWLHNHKLPSEGYTFNVTDFNKAPTVIDFDTFEEPKEMLLKWKKPKEEKETTMGYEYNMEVDQRNHLKRRLDLVYKDKNVALEKQFFIFEPEGPRTKDELTKCLASGGFSINESFFDKKGNLDRWANPQVAISWRTEATQADMEGYEAAKKLLDKAYTDTKDAIIVKPLTDGLAALQAFEG